ncbi:hypothetical protein [Solitalea lacus]|uniref:hypothetical protein n=1 Tax=Solitalea lacus TaxID=2911172 RepID=UPI001EDACA1F|nr:hypothetical protein [Solitalea lacus]UKJ06580.1 hypothetical protein L2B55_13705 [Solitalea lacus]
MSKASATISFEFASTGCFFTCGEEFNEVCKWSKYPTLRALLNHPTKKKFIKELRDNDITCCEKSLCFFRGRTDKPASSRNMGPAPRKYCVPGGRYNKIYQSVLYLSNSIFGVEQEFVKNKKLRPGDMIYIQEYNMPLANLNIGNLSLWYLETPNSYVGAVMTHCELSKDNDRTSDYPYPSYLFSQTIAG